MTDVSNSAALPRWWNQARGTRLALVAILATAVVLTTWNLARGGDFAFYEASARSMSQSWKALLFGAFDPDATVTLDKLSGFAIPQAASIHLFGLSTSAVALPQVVEGLVTVWACALIGLRWGGPAVGLVAAAAAATTPIFVSMFGHPMEDGLLTMALAVAFLWWQRAVLTARWWPLLLAGLFVGVGFQAKMLQAWFVLPALVVATLVAGSGAASHGGTRGRTLARAGALTGTAVATSLAWITVVQLVPAADRPYVDGSTDNNVFAMVFGYNGLDRFLPGAWPGAVSTAHGGGATDVHHTAAAASAMADTGHGIVAAATSAPGGGFGGAAASSATKLIDPTYLTQVGWLYPVAIVGIALGVWRWWPTAARRRQATREDRVGRATFVAVVVWLVTAVVVLSAAHLPHTAYVAALGVPLALLAAVGAVGAVRLARSARLSRRLVLPGLLMVQAAWAGWLAVTGGLPAALLVAFALVVVIGTVVVLIGALRDRAVPTSADRPARGRRFVAVVAAATLLAGPACFSAQIVDPARDGSGGDASVGTRQDASVTAPFTVAPPALWGGHGSLSTEQAALVARARAAGGGQNGRPLFLTDSWAISAAVIDATGDSVLTDGGYSGQVPVFTEADLVSMIASGRNRLFVVQDRAPADDPVRRTVEQRACTSLGTWGESGEQSGSGGGGTRVAAADLGSSRGKPATSGFGLWQCS